MPDLAPYIELIQARPELFLLGTLGLGILIVVVGLAGAFSGPEPEIRRMRSGTAAGRGAGVDLLSRSDTDPRGILKVFVPTSEKDRNKLRRKMRQAGVQSPNAVRNFYVVRTLLGILLPGALLGLLFLPDTVPLPVVVVAFAAETDLATAFQYVTVLVVIGFYGPSLWLKSRIDERHKQIERGLPNALDLLQVAVEAGMGFDAAMNRVARELVDVVPAISQEFMTVQLEIQAGMDREKAFAHLAERTGVDEMSAFANVIMQSSRFGTSISSALATYAEEMRVTRELKAQERANKLPVKMSGIMALMMMPVLLMITLTPVAIRWIRMFEGL